MATSPVRGGLLLLPVLALVTVSITLNGIYRRKKLAARDVEYSFIKGSLEDGSRRVVLVTGGLGLVGREIVRLLLEDGSVAVRCFDLHLNPSGDSRVTRIRGQLESFDHCERACQGVDSVIHCAALLGPLGVTEEDLLRVNVLGTQTLLLACYVRQVKRLVVTSSVAAVLDRQKGQLMQQGDEKHVHYPASKEDFIEPYGYTKYLVERVVLSAHGPSLKTACLRPSIVFGERDGKLAERLLQGLDRNLVGDGENVLDFVHVSDVAWAHILCERALIKAPSLVGGRAYFVGTGKPIKNKDFFDFGFGAPQPVPLPVVRFFCGINQIVWFLFKRAPFSVWLYPEALDTISTNWCFPIDAAKDAFGYNPKSADEAKQMMLSKRT